MVAPNPRLGSHSGRHLGRIEVVERDENIHCLSKQGVTVGGSTARLAVSRATTYRRMDRLEDHPSEIGGRRADSGEPPVSFVSSGSGVD
ncbi:hypothetical protein J3A64_001519 [Pseudarthrobacter sp. PvP004]|nr:hypothetical protein [Pseudarthrobacter sp. PvP004]